ncbi:outer membrane protein/peptidoglycan-associated (lipo)protein [Aequorivita sublithincola DSM 14238]|uniref:Outer membrane protein/peptidoglycan-associated (Lipo)protein n=1 Tax=Aequorivita sublithincola (strain DSM 14238 / LMG 21431 / ACAM 643 / 9-3) TaxID=746697 RepID=I3YS27_AEQSU|nr:OmpA family protein [Aequorivita sublithincola]AFL79795.1 outer membrane protein/peptidoglycan-associated (lipo)protein [Aequorivita sublithincola DSM 14238]
MFRYSFLLLIVFSIWGNFIFAQKGTGKLYRVDRYESIYLPLGKISFADSLVEFKVGSPASIKKYRDSFQCLHEPNYKNYQTPNFVSLGCGGSLTVKFIDNGFMNLPGDDLYIFEVGPSREAAKVEISQNGTDWVYAGKIAGGKSSIELSKAGVDDETVFYFLRITDMKELCRSISAGADIDAIGAINSVIKLTISADVLFDVAKYGLKETAKQTLDSLVKTIQKVDNATILIEGHTDSDGDEASNILLSQNRCDSVKDRLIAIFGASSLYDFETRALGESKPRVPNDSDANKQLNRRVEITVLPPKAYYESLKNN